MQLTNAGVLKVDHITRATGGHPVTVDTNLYCALDCSALTFTDRTPFYSGDALSEILKIKGKNGKVDHATLPRFTMSISQHQQEIVWKDKTKKTILKTIPAYADTGRDLGATISMLIVATQQLSARCDSLEKLIKK
jgi:hypothetical protein